MDLLLKKKITDMLKKKKKKHEEELQKLSVAAKNNLKSPITVATDPADSDVAVLNIPLALLENKRKVIKKYNEAIRRVERGEYGVCMYCECQIPIARLEAVPFTDKCVKCKEKLEEEDTESVNGTKRRISKYKNGIAFSA